MNAWLKRLGLLVVLFSFCAHLHAQGVVRFTLSETDVIREHLFGISVALSDDELLVGSPGDFDAYGPYAGAVHIFRRRGDQWLPYDTLKASDDSSLRGFGRSIALDSVYALIRGGARRINRPDGTSFLFGSVYVFKREGDRWAEQTKLTPPPDSAYSFGPPLALHDDFAFVGARDGTRTAVYIFKRHGDTWEKHTKLTPSRSIEEGNDEFGSPLCLAGDWLAVGAHRDDERGRDAGAVYVYQRQDDTWAERAKLMASDAKSADQFGRAIACTDEEIIISAYSGGSTYVFKRAQDQWIEQRERIVVPGDPENNRFLWPIFMNDTYLVLSGSKKFDAFLEAGVAYFFKRNEQGWAFLRELSAPDASQWDGFGQALAAAGDWMAFGAPYKDTYREEEGAVYVIHARAIDRHLEIPASPVPYVLGFAQNYPNPFSESTTIRYSVPRRMPVRLVVYDLLGRELATLVEAQQDAGLYTIDFEAQNLPAGLYFYRIEMGHLAFTHRMMLIR